MSRRTLTIVVLGVLIAGGCAQGPSTQAMKARGDLAFADRDYLQASEWYEQYIVRQPLDGEVRYKLGTAYLGLKRPTPAREQFLQGLELGDPGGLFIEGIASALVETGQRDELFRLLRSHAQSTRQPDDYIRFGRFATLVGDPDVGREALLDAARIDLGRSLAPQLALAEFYGSVGDTENQLLRLRMALFIDPDNEAVTEDLRALGEVPGPTLALIPAERQ